MVANQASSMRYRCTGCGTVHARWAARCSSCGAFKVTSEAIGDIVGAPPEPVAVPVIEPELVRAPATSSRAFSPEPVVLPPSVPIPLSDVEAESYVRLRTGVDPFDDVLGGGLVVGSLVLLSADPGAGKSTLLNQVLDGVHVKCLYATGEETVAQAAARARRLCADSALVYIVSETRLEVIFQHAQALGVEVLAIDSIQTLTHEDVKGAAGTVTQVRECTQRIMRFAKTTNITTIVIGHVTHDGAISGPKTLEHMVDTVLMMEVGEGYNRLLRSSKNRFGSTAKVGKLVMTPMGLEPAAYEASPDGSDDGSVH